MIKHWLADEMMKDIKTLLQLSLFNIHNILMFPLRFVLNIFLKEKLILELQNMVHITQKVEFVLYAGLTLVHIIHLCINDELD